MIFFGERRLREAVTSYLAHYHVERAHQGLGNRRINASSVAQGEVVCDERLGGLLKCYRRAS
jgi:putative transposase